MTDLSIKGAIAALEKVGTDAPIAEDPKDRGPGLEDDDNVVDDDDDDGADDGATSGADDDDDGDDDSDGASASEDGDGEDGSDDDQTTDGADDDDGDGEPSKTAIEAPSFLDEAGRKQFAKMPRDAQEFVSKQSQLLQSDYSRKTAELAEKRKLHLAGIDRFRGVMTEKEKRMAKWEKVDWAKQAQELDPKVYNRNVAQYQKEKREFEEGKAQLQREEVALLETHDREQATELKRIAPDLYGPKGKDAREKVIDTVLAAGIDRESVRMMSAVEMLFVHEAIQWRRYQAERKKPSKLTPKQGDKAKGKVVRNAAKPGSSSSQHVVAAKKRFNSKPSAANARQALDALDVD